MEQFEKNHQILHSHYSSFNASSFREFKLLLFTFLLIRLLEPAQHNALNNAFIVTT